MTKATELREMSDEQLALTLKETTEQPVPSAAPGADRAARRPQRAAQAAPADRPDQDDSEPAAACREPPRSSRSREAGTSPCLSE